MQGKRNWGYLLPFVFAFTLALRLVLAFQSANFEAGDAYFTYRQVESIKATLLPEFSDELSFSGMTLTFTPLYYYLLAPFSFLFGTVLALKVIPNILASFLVVIVYYIVLEMTRSRRISLFCSFAAAFIPVFFASTVNSALRLSLTLPLVFYLIYCFLRIRERFFLYQFIIFAFVLALTSAVSMLFVFALLLYLMLVKLEFRSSVKVELETILFVTFLTIWTNILVYKKAFLFHSYSLIWQNIPHQILDAYFRQVDLVDSVAQIGLLPLILGVFAVYRYMFKEHDRRTYLLMAFALAVSLLLWLKLITLEVGLIFLGAILIPLMGQALKLLFTYLEKTKIASWAWAFWLGMLLLVVVTQFLPSIARASVHVSDSVTDEEMDALLWIKSSTPQDSVILSTIGEGSLVNAIAGRRNVADNDFILVRSSADVFDDVSRMYTSILKTSAVELMDKYGVDYIYFSPRAKADFGIDSLKYAEKDCFERVYGDNVRVYRVLCEVNA